MLALTGPAPAAVRALAFKAAGNLARDQNDLGAVELDLVEALGDAQGTARSLTTLGLILGRSGRIMEGLQLLARAADLRMQANDRVGLARSLENIAWCQAKLGDASAAAWLLGQAESLREAVDVPLSADDHVEYDETVTRLQSALEADERAALRAAGRAAPPTEAPFRAHVQFQPNGEFLSFFSDIASCRCRRQSPRGSVWLTGYVATTLPLPFST